ncbi:MAG TPA: hypothetical protein PK587_02040 [Syntrophales bacterium]|nr:hypothetical protein [Syntrophales bacterium]
MNDSLDTALRLLEAAAPEYSGGIVNHGQIVAGAMKELNREESILPWVSHYRRRLGNQCQAGKEIRENAWRRYLGRFEYCAAWNSFFARKTAEGEWRRLAGQWLARLAPGVSASGGQALIRTTHALRALESKDNPVRRKELAHSLGYWAARYRRLPGSLFCPAGGLKPSEAIHRVRRLPRSARTRFGMVEKKLGNLWNFPPFRNSTRLVDGLERPDEFISDLVRTVMEVLLSNGKDLRTTVAFINAANLISESRRILPLLPRDGTRNMLLYVWQAAAGVYAACGNSPPARSDLPVRDRVSGEKERNLVDEAVASGNEQLIELAETCTRESGLNPAPVFPAALHRAVRNLREIDFLS